MDDDLIAFAEHSSEVITESTAIDDQAGLLMWWRHVESRGGLKLEEWGLNNACVCL